MQIKSVFFRITANGIGRHGFGDYATTAAFDLLKASGEITTTTGRVLQDKEVAHGNDHFGPFWPFKPSLK